MASCQLLPWHQELILHPHPTPPFPNNSVKEDSEIWHMFRVDKPPQNYNAVRTSFPLNYNWYLLPPQQSFSTTFRNTATQVLGSFSMNLLLRWIPLSPWSDSYSCLPKRCKRLWQLPWQQKSVSSRCIWLAENSHERNIANAYTKLVAIPLLPAFVFLLLPWEHKNHPLEHIWAQNHA